MKEPVNIKSHEIRHGLIYIGVSFLAILVLMNQASILKYLHLMLSVISPFILGLAIAFVFNAPMRNIEMSLFGPKSFLNKLPQAVKRVTAYLITLALISAVVAVFVLTVVPGLTKTFIDFINALPKTITDLEAWISREVSLDTDLGYWLQQINFEWETVRQNILLFAQQSVKGWLDSSFLFVSGVFNTFINLIIAFVFSVYVLLGKERLIREANMILEAYVKPTRIQRIHKVAAQANTIFSSYVYGQVIEAVIVGVIFFVVMSLLRFPYTLLISVIIGFTALIPVVGSMIGMTIGMILIATKDPIQALWFYVAFQLIQQFEGNLIYPHVVGRKIGLPAIWVLVAITIGGSLFGLLGIILSIPTFTLFYVLFKERVNERLASKTIQ